MLEILLRICLFSGPYADAGTSIDCAKSAQNFLGLRGLVIVLFRDYEPRISPHHLAEVSIALRFTERQLRLHELMVPKANCVIFFINGGLLH